MRSAEKHDTVYSPDNTAIKILVLEQAHQAWDVGEVACLSGSAWHSFRALLNLPALCVQLYDRNGSLDQRGAWGGVWGLRPVFLDIPLLSLGL